MSLQLEDISPFLEKKRQDAKSARIEQMRHQVAVAKVMSELQADPRWATLGNHAEAIKLEWVRSVNGYKQTLNGNEFLEPKKYGQLKMNQAKAEGVVFGMEIVLGLAKTLIERGEAAMKVVEAPKPIQPSRSGRCREHSIEGPHYQDDAITCELDGQPGWEHKKCKCSICGRFFDLSR